MVSLYAVIPEKLVKNCMLFLMRDGIQPMWEDPKNSKGGCFSFKVTTKVVPQVWKKLSYITVGETLTNDTRLLQVINGITISGGGGTGVEILVATPGRLLDHIQQKTMRLSQVEILVLDEADRMFDLGFIKDIRYLLRRLPKPQNRLNMLFSATLSHRVLELAYEHMNDPELIKIEAEKMTADNIRQAIFFPSNEDKIPLLIGLIKEM